MIYITGSNKKCTACGNYEKGKYSYQIIKEIHITIDGQGGSYIPLCSKCRQELINKVSTADGQGKLLEVKQNDK